MLVCACTVLPCTPSLLMLMLMRCRLPKVDGLLPAST
jgi:hypothetical protein